MIRKLFIFFSAGCAGALVNSVLVWQFGQLGINSAVGVSIMPHLSAGWLYPRIVWGGIWGLLFILPFLQSRLLSKGAVLSLFPSAVQLLLIFPNKGQGIGGVELGLLTPLLVLFFNWVWGLSAALAIKFAQ